MAWQQLHIIIPSEQTEAFENHLLEAGALSITLQDAADEPLFEPALSTTPLWTNTKLSALFMLDYDLKKIAGDLQSHYPGQTLSARFERLADQDWERAWLEHFKPMCFAEKLWIVPTGYDIPDPNAVNLFLDPGLAFGTGTHPTTAMCLDWLASHDLQGKSLLDYGCGSGILAVAGLKLGAAHAWAIDYDPQALQATEQNASRNAVDLTTLDIGQNADLPEAYQAEIIVANILANPLIHLANTLCQHLKPGGNIVLSGILAEQADDVVHAYQPFCHIEPVEQQDDWVRIVGVK